MPKQIIIIRHGESEKDKTNPQRGLTKHGQKQIKQAAQKIAKFTLGQQVKIISTPTDRAMETAAILSQILNANLNKTFDNLRVENIERVAKDRENLTEKYFKSAKENSLPKKVPSPKAMARRFLYAILQVEECDILIIIGHSAALESFANNQSIYIPKKKVERELKYGEFIVLNRQK